MAEVKGVNHILPEEMLKAGQGASEDLIKRLAEKVVYVAQNAMWEIGDGKWSCLTEEQFALKHGYDHTLPEHEKKWVIEKGQSIAGSKLHAETGIATLPNRLSTGAVSRQLMSGKGMLQYEANQNKAHAHNMQFKNPAGVTGSGEPKPYGYNIYNGSGCYIDNGTWGTWDTSRHRMTSNGGAEARMNAVSENYFRKIND